MGVVATGGDSGGAPSLCTQCVCMRANGQDSLLKQIQNMGFRRGGAIAAAGEGREGEERRGEEKSHAVLPPSLLSLLINI